MSQRVKSTFRRLGGPGGTWTHVIEDALTGEPLPAVPDVAVKGATSWDGMLTVYDTARAKELVDAINGGAQYDPNKTWRDHYRHPDSCTCYQCDTWGK